MNDKFHQERRTTGMTGNPAEIAETPQRHDSKPPIASIEMSRTSGMEALVLALIVVPPSQHTIAVMNALWTKWGITQWEDIECFNAKDVQDFFKEEFTETKVLIQKKIAFVVEFARHNTLQPTTKMRDIIDFCEKQRDDKSVPSVVSHNTSNTDEKKKSVPKLEKFSGQDEDYYHWRDTIINDLGRHGLGKFVLVKDSHELYGGQSESVFYAIRAALSGGLAAGRADSMYDQHDYNPYDLWNKLKEYYDTTLNRANINVYEIRRLLGLTLDTGTTPLKFIADMKECLQRLKTNKAQISTDNETLRAFLLVALQDDDYDSIRDIIIEKPERAIDDLLNNIRQKDTSLQLKEGVRRLQGDGSTITSRRTSTNKAPKNTSVIHAMKNGKWIIPSFPPGWKQVVGSKIFKVMTDWRKAAIHNNTLQEALNKRFAFRVEEVHSHKRARSVHTATSSAIEKGKDAGDDGDKMEVDSESATKRRRVTLQKSRRVVTEVDGE